MLFPKSLHRKSAKGAKARDRRLVIRYLGAVTVRGASVA